MSLLKKMLKHIDRPAAVRVIACALVLVVTLSICGFEAKCDTVRENVLRLHILANSDSDEDQALKLKVRDALLTVSEAVFEDCTSESEAALMAQNSLELFTQTAQQTVLDNGYDYSVRVEIADTWFETRDYEDFSLPAGTYEALRVIIGNGEGHNWWCVMFPSICLPAASGKNDGFSNVLEDDTAEIVEQPKRYKARFKIVEVFEKARKSIADAFGR